MPPLRTIVDFVSAPDKQFDSSEHVKYFVRLDSVIARGLVHEIKLEAWVGSEASKRELEKRMKVAERGLIMPPEGQHADVIVVSDRIQRFKQNLALGARKEMDWAVLDEV